MRRPRHSLSRRQFAAGLTLSGLLRAQGSPEVTMSCPATSDLFQILSSGGVQAARFDDPIEAVRRAPHGSAVLLLAAQEPLVLTSELIATAGERKLRVFAEYCGWQSSEAPRVAEWERVAVVSNLFGEAHNQRILSAHRCRYVPSPQPATIHLRLARIAGFDYAVFGVPGDSTPLLYEPAPGFMIAATTLSQFVTSRYGPVQSWLWVWEGILGWLKAPATMKPSTPRVRPSYSATAVLPANAEAIAMQRGAAWYGKARLFIHPKWAHKVAEAASWKDQVGPAPEPSWPLGDGSLGLLEGHASDILPDGSQNARWWIRADCVGETAMTLALAHGPGAVSRNLIDYLFGKTQMSQGPRADPASASYGLIGWNAGVSDREELNGVNVYYGDDNARCLIGAITAEALAGRTKWNERIWRAVLANFRTSGRLGHREWRHDEGPLSKKGWRFYYDQENVLHDMNYQASAWSLFLWAYQQTGYAPFLHRIERGIRLTMEAYPKRWRCSNSMTLEQARLLLTLAWLVRVSDTPEHRGWLRTMAGDILLRQHKCGAIAEWLADVETGVQMPPTSNEKYGLGEGTLIQSNGDPAADLLYTVNFTMIGLHEAAAATGDPYYVRAANRLAEFVVRCQARAVPSLSQFDGAWFRAFDFSQWDYWSSSSDAGWGAWSTESGWSQSWLTSTLALRVSRRSLWKIVTRSRVDPVLFKRALEKMIPEAGKFVPDG
ncbi:MAG: hypothetical protein SGI92_02185 [Bryobacteraceae bacterium]|nr:hypothetical protein [Bryobacteraceae bacterium]